MGWFKVDDHYFTHPKVWEAGEQAALLNLQGMAYCSANQTDGRIPKGIVPRLTENPEVSELVSRLLEAGLWRENAKHYVIHDYLEHQSSRAQIRAKREGAANRKRKSRAGRGVTGADSHTGQVASVTAPDVDTETDVDGDVEADRPTTGFKDSPIEASALQALETQSPDGFEAIVASIGNGGVDDSRAAA